jgi:hypothetical protein
MIIGWSKYAKRKPIKDGNEIAEAEREIILEADNISAKNHNT